MTNLDKKLDAVLSNPSYSVRIRAIFKDIYTGAYHEGRHAEREKLAKSGFLTVDPEKFEEFRANLEDPCRFCSNYTTEYKIGCTVGKACPKYEKHLLCLEILKYFVNDEDKQTKYRD